MSSGKRSRLPELRRIHADGPRLAAAGLVWAALFVMAAAAAPEPSVPGAREFRPVFELRGRDTTHDNGLLLLRSATPDGTTTFAMIPPLVQGAGVEATGGSSVRYILGLQVAWTPKIEDLIFGRTNRVLPAPLAVQSLTIQIPELGFVATVRGDAIPPLVPRARLTVPIDVNPDRVQEAYERLTAQKLNVRLIFRFGATKTTEAGLMLTRDEFVDPVPVFAGSPDSRPLYRYADIENRLGEMKNRAAASEGAAFQPLHQTRIDGLLAEWFEEVQASGQAEREAVATAQRAPQAQQVADPWKGLSRGSFQRVFHLKPEPVSPLEIVRLAVKRTSDEFVQSLSVGFTPTSVPPQLDWREIERETVKVRAPCGASPSIRLPLTVAANQKLELVLGGGLFRRDVQPLNVRPQKLDVGGVTHALAPAASSTSTPRSWSTVLRAGGRPQLVVAGPACPSTTTELSITVVLYE